MTNRRQFLGIGLAASALPFASSPLHAALATDTAAGADTVPLYKVLYDVRFPASMTFARRATARGIPVQAMAGDMTPFWYDDLYHRWQRSPVAIAGLTAHAALFCLERLAWDQRMRVVFRAEHAATAAAIAHTIEAPRNILGAAARAVAGPAWASAIADFVLQYPRAAAALATRRVETPYAAPVDTVTEPLFSWLIAPVARV
jgi:hypothetical protein